MDGLKKIISEELYKSLLMCEVKIQVKDYKKQGYATQIGKMYADVLKKYNPTAKAVIESAKYNISNGVAKLVCKTFWKKLTTSTIIITFAILSLSWSSDLIAKIELLFSSSSATSILEIKSS